MIIATIDEAIAAGHVVDDGKTSRNRMQIGTLLGAIEENGFTAAFGGGRRDEEKARAKERVYSHRDDFGQWDPKMQRPELWSLYNGRIHAGEHMRIFPLSNWTELDIWHYIHREQIEIPSIYFAHEREVIERDGMLLSRRPGDPAQGRREGRDQDGALPHRGRPHPDRLRGVARPPTPPPSSTRSPSPGSPSAAPPVATTGSPRRPWKTARRKATSDGQHPTDAHTAAQGEMDLLRFATAGSVDDGKSTLIGRLLLDSKSIFEDQLEAVESTSQSKGYDYTDLALLTDGLRSEREQGITIDVAYRYFATPGPQVHHRRHPGPHPVHPQHGDRRLDRRPGPRPRRRPPGPDRAVAPPRGAALAAAGPAPRARDQQDGPRRLVAGDLREDPQGVHDLRDQAQHPRPRGHPDLGAPGRQRRQPVREHPVVLRPDAHAPPRARPRRLRPRPRRHPLPGAVRHPPQVRPVPRLPRLRRPGRRWRAEEGRRGRRAAQRHDVDHLRASSSSTRRSPRRSRRCR